MKTNKKKTLLLELNGNEDGNRRPKEPEIKPPPAKPDIKTPDKPEISPDIPKEPEISPGKTKEPEIPLPPAAPAEPYE